MTRHPTPATATFIGAAGNKLVADVFGDSGSPVLLLHGGGQTRHAWYKTAEEIARKGHTAYALGAAPRTIRRHAKNFSPSCRGRRPAWRA